MAGGSREHAKMNALEEEDGTASLRHGAHATKIQTSSAGSLPGTGFEFQRFTLHDFRYGAVQPQRLSSTNPPTTTPLAHFDGVERATKIMIEIPNEATLGSIYFQTPSTKF